MTVLEKLKEQKRMFVTALTLSAQDVIILAKNAALRNVASNAEVIENGLLIRFCLMERMKVRRLIIH